MRTHRLLILLSLAYSEGDAVPQDTARAEKFLRTAAEAGVQVATETLAKITFSAEGFSNPDFFQAIDDGDFKSLQADPTTLCCRASGFVVLPAREWRPYCRLFSTTAGKKGTIRSLLPIPQIMMHGSIATYISTFTSAFKGTTARNLLLAGGP